MLYSLKNKLPYLFLVVPLLFVFVQSSELLDRQITPRIIAFSAFLTIAGIVLYFKKSIEIKQSALFLLAPLFLYFIWSGIGLSYTINRADGFAEVLKSGLLLGGVLAVYSLPEDTGNFKQFFIKTGILTALVLSVWATLKIGDIYFREGFSHQAMYELRTGMGHKNILSEYLLLLLPFSVYAVIYESKLWKSAAAASCFFIVIILILSMTRSVWAAGTAAFILTVIVLYFARKASGFPVKKASSGLLILTAALIATIAVLYFTDRESLIVKQFTSAFDFTHGSVKDRLLMWQKSLNLAAETPLIGRGPGSWKIFFLKTGNEGLLSSDNLTFYQRPHNDFIWVLNEHGAVGQLFYAGAFAAAVALSIKNTVQSKSGKELIFSSAILFSLAAYICISLFSFPKERPAFTVLLSFLWGFILLGQIPSSSTELKKIPRVWLSAFLILSGVAGVWIGSDRYTGEKHLKKVLNHRSAGNDRKVINNAKRAESRFYKFDNFSTPVRWYAASAYYNLGNTEKACHVKDMSTA